MIKFEQELIATLSNRQVAEWLLNNGYTRAISCTENDSYQTFQKEKMVNNKKCFDRITVDFLCPVTVYMMECISNAENMPIVYLVHSIHLLAMNKLINSIKQ